MAIKLDLAVLEAGLGTFEREINGDVLAFIQESAQLIKSVGDSNTLTDEILALCGKAEGMYNIFLDGAIAAKNDLGQVVDLAEYEAKKATLGDIQTRDASFDGSNIDTSDAIRSMH